MRGGPGRERGGRSGPMEPSSRLCAMRRDRTHEPAPLIPQTAAPAHWLVQGGHPRSIAAAGRWRGSRVWGSTGRVCKRFTALACGRVKSTKRPAGFFDRIAAVLFPSVLADLLAGRCLKGEIGAAISTARITDVIGRVKRPEALCALTAQPAGIDSFADQQLAFAAASGTAGVPVPKHAYAALALSVA